MKQRTAILLAMGLTAFVVILVGAVAFVLTTKAVPTQETPIEALGEESLAGEIGQALPTAPVVVVQPTAVAAPKQPALLSTTRATQVALQALPGGTALKTPELVNFQGKMAYEVLLSGGTVYVDAFTGLVLSSAATVVSNPVPDSSAPQGGGGNQAASNNDPAPQPVAQSGNPNDNFIATGGGDNFNDNGDDNDDDNGGHGGGDDDDEDRSGKGGGGDDDDEDRSGKGGGGDDDDKDRSGKGGGGDDD